MIRIKFIFRAIFNQILAIAHYLLINSNLLQFIEHLPNVS